MLRRINDCRRRVEKNRYKFITTYVETFHEKVYKEAEELYHAIRQDNPDTKDLTKTIEFLKVVSPGKRVPKYYEKKRKEMEEKYLRETQEKYSRGNNNGWAMQLNIPLMDIPDRPEQLNIPLMDIPDRPEQGNTPQLDIPDRPEQGNTPQLDIPGRPEQGNTPQLDIPDRPEQGNTPQLDIPDHPEQGNTPRLDIPDHAYFEMLEEIRKDPQLERIFSDFDMQGSDGTMDYFISDDMSPLEVELAQHSYE